MNRRALFVVASLVLGCGAEAPAPDKPTWAEDVQPILQANCFHCHGATANRMKAKRWDVFDLNDPVYATLGFTQEPMAPSFIGASGNALIPLYVELPTSEAFHMPPLPATPLSSRDIQVLKNWMATKTEKGRRSPNLKPVITWLTRNRVL